MRNKECRVTEEPTVAEKEFDSSISYTSSIFSVVEVVNPKDRYVVGDVVRILITARDNKNVTKTHGGDYMRLKLYTEQTQSSWAIDVTNDLGNGTYLADVELRWPGIVQVIVTLIHSHEAIQVLRRIRQNDAYRIVFIGRYVVKKKTYEDVLCLPRKMENVSILE